MRCYLVRHCEKVEWSDDPPLTPAGRRRAQALAETLSHVDLRKVIVTSLRRTLETATPAIDALKQRGGPDLDPVVLAPGAYSRIVQEVWSVADGASLVVGHMQTVPALVRRIASHAGAPSLSQPTLVRYGDLFELHGEQGGDLVLRTHRFGDDVEW